MKNGSSHWKSSNVIGCGGGEELRDGGRAVRIAEVVEKLSDGVGPGIWLSFTFPAPLLSAPARVDGTGIVKPPRTP